MDTKSSIPVNMVEDQSAKKSPLTDLEKAVRKEHRQSIRMASYGADFGNVGGANIKGANSNFYSPQLSTDFLELPQSEREKRELYRFWYLTHPIVGAAIDFHCFPPGAPVLLPDGTTKPIESLSVGDQVINGFGEKTRILNTFKDRVQGPITRIKVRGIQESIDCTENHPFLVYRSDQVNCKYSNSGTGLCKQGSKSICAVKKCHGMDFEKPTFVFAKDLKAGDYVCSPSLQHLSSSFNRNQLRLLGYYAAEGSTSKTIRGTLDRVVFSLNKKEHDTVGSEIAEMFEQEYSHQATKHDRFKSNSCQVRCYKREFAEFCVKHAGSLSHGKQLSQEIMDSPREDILEFLGAYWNGDGSLTKNGFVATTVSKSLAWQIWSLAMKVGYAASIKSQSPRKSHSGFKSDRVTYRVMIPYRYHEEFLRYANFVQNGYGADTTREYSTWINGSLVRRIESVETVDYDGYVHNIEVDGEGDRKSYVAYGLATHNTDVPMSKIRLSLPKGKDVRRNKQILHFYQEMCNRIRLFQTLYDATHEYWLHGNAFLFVEDHDLTSDVPEHLIMNVENEEVGTIDYSGQVKTSRITKKVPKPESERSKNIREFVQKNYMGWQRVTILPPEQVKMEVFQYTNKARVELIPSEKDRLLVLRATEQNDAESAKIAEDIPEQIRNSLLSGAPIPLNTSPYDDFLCSSFCYHLAHKKSAYDDRGVSLLERVLRTLVYQDKLRQAQTSIASRAMTPKRIVWADKMSEVDVDSLRDQVDQALLDPDFTIVTNFEVHWDEIGSRDRLLDLSNEYETTNKMLYIGLRITESMLTGESTFSGERIHLDVMNTMYLLYREQIAELVEEWLFKPVAEKKGFWEEDEYGNRVLLYPKLQFTRLALRDNSELQDYMFNLYQKGSLPISFILDLLNIDYDDTMHQLLKDLFTPADANFNDFSKQVLQDAASKAGESTDAFERIFKAAGLSDVGKKGDRFGKEE